MRSRSRRRSIIVLIALFKLLKAALLMTAGVGLSRFAGAGGSGAVVEWASAVHVDPDGRYLKGAIQALATLNGERLEAVRVGMVIYAAVYLTEGTGLFLGRRWAEYFTVIITSSFVPLEMFAYARRPDDLRLSLLLANVAVVCYVASGIRRR